MSNIKIYDELVSTNLELRSIALNGAEAGTVIAARRQSGGKGRMGRSFSSPEGGVYFSMLLKPEDPGKQLLLLTPLAAVAVYRTVKELCNVECSIKWPNDLMCSGRKLCGILTEAVTVGSRVNVIVGIGVNLNTAEFPAELKETAVSVKQLTGEDTDIELFVHRLADELTKVYSDKNALEFYRAHCINIGKRISVIREDREISGLCLGVNDDFSLRIRYDSGDVENVFFGEVTVKKA